MRKNEVVHEVINGEFFWWPSKLTHICCGCGLVHEVETIPVRTAGSRRPRMMAAWTVNDKETVRQRKIMKRKKKR